MRIELLNSQAPALQHFGQGFSLARIDHRSASNVELKLKRSKASDSVESERIDYLSQVVSLAKQVFEDKGAADRWMVAPNDSLGGRAPVSLCETEHGALQVLRVLRVLRAVEWGGAI